MWPSIFFFYNKRKIKLSAHLWPNILTTVSCRSVCRYGSLININPSEMYWLLSTQASILMYYVQVCTSRFSR